jgi:hypothetical protein
MGSFTNFTSGTSDIATILIPFGAADEVRRSDLRTDAKRGATYVHIYNTLQESFDDGRIDPLWSLRSGHKVEDRSIMMRYPYSGYGGLKGVARGGN